jgi:hypothetical protein
VFSAKFLDQWLAGIDKTVYKSEKGSALDKLCRDIRHYHTIPKTELKNLDRRRKKLLEIARQTSKLMQRAGIDLQQAAQRTYKRDKQGQLTNEVATTLEQSVERILLSIQRRAERKAGYLKVLKEYYSSKESRDVAVFKRMIGQAHVVDQDLIGLHQGSRLEAIDPMHRDFELPADTWKQDRQGTVTGFDVENSLVVKQKSYDWEFAKWFNTEAHIPFFLYLENTEFCLLTGNGKTAKISYSRLDRNEINVAKQGSNSQVQSCCVYCGWVYSGAPGGKETSLCDTRGYAAQNTKGGPGYAAFAFSEHEELYLAAHMPGTWHHTSFLSGNPVRCAGMIKIVQGNVQGVNDSSGHYHPRPKHLYNFVKWLHKKSVLDSRQLDIELIQVGRRFRGWAEFDAWASEGGNLNAH